ncbi:MAG TPA: hypothetical protein VHU41_19745 [Thermoanaerobaculia bacterium]|jgi:hypothetical protein|nr:hypothetical protein [Thermoanaerobaculia bacterium]
MNRVSLVLSLSLAACLSASAGTRHRAVTTACLRGYVAVSNLAPDNDGDGYWSELPATVCAAATPVRGWITGSLYYHGQDGRWYVDVTTPNNGGDDCDDTNSQTYRLKFGGLDAEHTGHVAGQLMWRCVGDTSLIDGRRYYTIGVAGSARAGWLDAADVTP